MDAFRDLFPVPWPVIGVIHLLPLPGSPGWGGNWQAAREHMRREAAALAEGGVHGIMLENFGDVPFAKDRVEPATVAAMALLAGELRGLVGRPVGVNVLRNDALAAVSIAAVAGADFVRVNVLIGAMVTDQGLIEGRARKVAELRARLGWRGQLWADVLVKHAAPLAPLDAVQAARDTVHRAGADVLIASGSGTGQATPLERLLAVKAAVPGTPLLAGSGATLEQLQALRAACDGCIVATSLQVDGRYDPARVRAFVDAAGK